jgi:hypothetical protein
MTSLPAAPSDVLAVWTGQGMAQDLIRVGEALEGKPAVANHVIVINHQDQVGRWMGIQGQPGGGPVSPRLAGTDLRSVRRQCRAARSVLGSRRADDAAVNRRHPVTISSPEPTMTTPHSRISPEPEVVA